MLAIASDWGSSTDDYLSENHPVQRAIKEAICDISGVREQDIIVAVDGCSAPTFALPLVNIARSFGRLASPPQKGPACAPSQPTVKSVIGKGRTWNRSGALAKVAEVMIKHPEMVGGEGRFDTELMRLLPRKVVTKGGAEGVQGVGVLAPSVRKGLQNPFGIAIKVMDGAGGRTLPMIAVEILDQLGVVGPDDLTLLKEKFDRRIKNHRGVPVGEIKTCFQLKWI
jgi:L-asparaginase II